VDEARYIDWYPVVQAVANGQLTGHACPECRGGPLEASSDGIWVRVRCPACSQGFEGKVGYGRDDALLAEADAMMARQAARRAAPPRGAVAVDAVCAPAPGPQARTAIDPPQPASAPGPTPKASERRPEPWQWSLPSGTGGDDVEALSLWMGVVHAIHNGRRTGLRCPFCSEPIDAGVTARPPYIRVQCPVCGETFEGRVE
jgi:ribosomal protein L37AE/L43A